MIERAFVVHRLAATYAATASQCAPMSKHMGRTSSVTPARVVHAHGVCDASPTPMEDVTLAPGVTDMPSPVIQHVAPASAVTYAVPSPVTEFVAPIPGVTCDETAPVTEYVAPVLGATDTAPSPAVDHLASASGVTDTAPSPENECVTPDPSGTDTPSPAIDHVSLATDVSYVVPSPVTEFVAPIPVVTFNERAPLTEYVASALGVTCTAPSPVTECAIPGVTDTPSPVIEHVVPASAVAYAVPSPLTEFVAPIPFVMAPALGVTYDGPAPVRDLRIGDIVYIRHRVRPFFVFRIGHGYLVSMVRVALLTEDTSIWEVGEWVGSERCYRLEVGDPVVAREDVMDTTDDPCMGRTSRCIFRSWDPGCNALLEEGLNRMVVPRKDMDKFTLHTRETDLSHTVLEWWYEDLPPQAMTPALRCAMWRL